MVNPAQRSQVQRKIRTLAVPVHLWYSHPATSKRRSLKAKTHGSLSSTHLGKSRKCFVTMVMLSGVCNYSYVLSLY